MQYQKITSGDILIEFHNNWLGEETVIANGHVVSKKSSVLGTHHYFTLMEGGHPNKYILTTKVNGAMQVLLDLRKNGILIAENVVVAYGTMPKAPVNTDKIKALEKLRQYDLSEALELFQKALEFDVKDPEIYFHMACIYSVQERTLEGFECLKKAVANQLQDQEMILNHDLLAFLRMNPAFEEFLNSNFTSYHIDPSTTNLEGADQGD